MLDALWHYVLYADVIYEIYSNTVQYQSFRHTLWLDCYPLVIVTQSSDMCQNDLAVYDNGPKRTLRL